MSDSMRPHRQQPTRLPCPWDSPGKNTVVACHFLLQKCSLGISNFLEDIYSLSHSIVFLYFFALITEEGFLISPCYSLKVFIQRGIFFLFSLAVCFSFFSAVCKASSDNHFAFLHFFPLGDGLDPCLP